MGYSGLNSYGESDMAADIYHSTVKDMVKALTNGFKTTRRENSYNTEGCVNIALIIRSGLLKNVDWEDVETDEYKSLLETALGDMEKLIKLALDKEDWDDERNRKHHLFEYRKMKGELQKELDKVTKAGD